ncbi:MAG: patatin-like phospholipase family protein [Bacilli bacterium]|nr:patatin-like phospholipase family protein [Bacilli bacterium]MBO7535834.1 patatin-like phospholipase family protein [Bacilli bacterium]MBP5550432.1 patatin-like phospholipase family protein [Bacilli bacterium]
MKKFGLTLGSGGARGIAHVGFLKALEENGIKPDWICGCSMGAIVGACYAYGMTPDEMIASAKKLRLFQILALDPFPYNNKGFAQGAKLEKVLAKYLKGATFENLNIPFSCVSYDLLEGKTIWHHDGNLLRAVRASCSIPIVFEPVKDNGRLLVDGGINERVPIKYTREMGADIVIAVDVLGDVRPTKKIKNLIELVTRATDILEFTVAKYKKDEEQADLLLPVDLGDASQYQIKTVNLAFEAGYKLGMENIDKIKALLND